MLVEGSEIGEWEPYGAMPSPEFPSLIRNVGDNVNVFDGELELGAINSSGANYNDSNCVRSKNYIEVEENETYVFSNDKGYQSIIYTFDANKQMLEYLNNQSLLKIPENVKYIRFRSSSTNNENDLSVKYKIEKGTTPTAYSKYGCGNANVTVCNKNLFTGFTKGKGLNASTGEEIIDVNSAVSDFIKVDFNKNNVYYLNNLLDTISSFIAAYDSNKKFIGRTSGSSRKIIALSKNVFTIQASSQASFGEPAFIRITQYGSAINDIDNLQVQLEIGITATDYVPHQEQTFILPIQQEMLLGDYFVKENDGWKEVHNWEKTIFNETDNFSVYITNDVFQFYLPTKAEKNSKLLCNMFLNKNDWISTSVVISSNSQLYFLIKKGEYGFTEDLSTEQALTKFKEIIEKNNIVLYNTTQTPIKLACTKEQIEVCEQIVQKAKSYKNVTNIFSADTVSPTFKVNYRKDIESMINNSLNNVNQQILNIV